MAPPKNAGQPRGTTKGSSSNNLVNFTIRASPLPRPILDFLLDNIAILRKLERDRKGLDTSSEEEAEEESVEVDGEITRKPTVKADQFWSALEEVLKSAGGEWAGILEQIWSFGPRQAGGCILIDSRKSGTIRS